VSPISTFAERRAELLIAFLGCNRTTRENVRVRITSSPQNSPIGRLIHGLKEPEPLAQSDVLNSWYFWIQGNRPKDQVGRYAAEVLTANGFIIYRSLLLDLSLGPESCETVMVEAGMSSLKDIVTLWLEAMTMNLQPSPSCNCPTTGGGYRDLLN